MIIRGRVERPKQDGRINKNRRVEYSDDKAEYIKNDKAKNNHMAEKLSSSIILFNWVLVVVGNLGVWDNG